MLGDWTSRARRGPDGEAVRAPAEEPPMLGDWTGRAQRGPDGEAVRARGWGPDGLCPAGREGKALPINK
jgi:hypothetical protein